jgi:hypothetical protein
LNCYPSPPIGERRWPKAGRGGLIEVTKGQPKNQQNKHQKSAPKAPQLMFTEAAGFWHNHHLIFIACMFFFPRLTLLLSDVVSGGFLWWLGWLIAPRLLVAILATVSYWRTNPILVALTWCWAFSGESVEKHSAKSIYGRVK